MNRGRAAIATLATAAAVALASAQERPAALTSVRLYVLDAGILESDPARYQLTAADVATTQLSVAAYLIVHAKGVLLWDTGAVPDDAWSPTGGPVAHRVVLPDGQERRVTIRATLGSQLKSAGYTPRDVTHLALSHYHWDHAANANAFAAATWLVRKEERDAMFGGTLPGTATPLTFRALEKSRTRVVVEDEHDVFGDGQVILKGAPGHTPGHQVLYVKLAKTGGVVLSGDLYHYSQERTLDRYPTFEFDVAQTRAARKAVDAFLSRTASQLWIQHDLPAHLKLKKAPQYYE
jgi:glyoxylase-like metal-dependent hydrolase (beta-lactamase superfamily II)